MSDSELAFSHPELEPYIGRATTVVRNAIANKGEVRSLPTSIGNIQSFEDSVAPEIWAGYIAAAGKLVDEGARPDTIDAQARGDQIIRVASMLRNQQLPEASA